MLESYQYLRPIAVFAGIFGMIQGLAWMGMAITGIVAFYCNIDFSGHPLNLSTMLDYTFYKLYFHGNCDPQGMPDNIAFDVLDGIQTMRPGDVHAWLWVYLVISFFWFISSITLLTNITIEYIKYANIFLFTWLFLTLSISILDFAIGILFGLDYSILFEIAHDFYPLVGALDTQITPNHLIIGNAKVASAIMMIIAFRGFIVWLVNIALVIYFFRETFKIYDYNKLHNNSKYPQINGGYVGEPHSILRAQPIDAYATNNRPNWTAHINNDPGRRERARSVSATPYEDRNRRTHYDQSNVQQQPRRVEDDVILRRDAAAAVNRELRHSFSANHGQNVNSRRRFSNEFELPRPDYSPVMQRGYNNQPPPLRSALRSSRF